jgi:tRNA threonylcarbamoyl adenosine modification protein YeaZ
MPDAAATPRISASGVLAIECSSRLGSVAVRGTDGRVRFERVPQGDRREEPLLPAIDRLFRDAGGSRRDLRAIAVSVGPGGFTGLRVATAAAKGIAEALDAATLAVPSAAVAAEAWRVRHRPSGAMPPEVVVLLQSKRESAWLERLAFDGERWLRAAPPGLADAAGVLGDAGFGTLGEAVLLADEHAPETLVAALRSRGIGRLDPPEPDAAACLAIAERALADEAAGHPGGAARTVDRLELAPLYPREPEAVTLWNLRHPG